MLKDDLNQQCSRDRENSFSSTFGKNEQSWLIAIGYANVHTRNEDSKERKLSEIWDGYPFIANYLLSSLNASYINLTYCLTSTAFVSFDYKIVHQKYQKFYEELTAEFDPVDANSL